MPKPCGIAAFQLLLEGGVMGQGVQKSLEVLFGHV